MPIRVFENLTGINIIVDDTPEAVILSSFDPVRREIARVTLENLIMDGRIHPARIEEMFEKASKIINNEIKLEGEQAVFDTGISGLNQGIIKVLGRLKYRTSYGQNVLLHSKEVSHIAGIIASELGLNINDFRFQHCTHQLRLSLITPYTAYSFGGLFFSYLCIDFCHVCLRSDTDKSIICTISEVNKIKVLSLQALYYCCHYEYSKITGSIDHLPTQQGVEITSHTESIYTPLHEEDFRSARWFDSPEKVKQKYWMSEGFLSFLRLV